MENVVEACETGKHALLESPTGTGKTLSLLCAVLSWKRHRNSEARVIYASKTHSQLANVVRELRKTPFKPKIAFLAARSRMCLHEKVSKGNPSMQSRKCRELRMARACLFSNDENVTRVSEMLLRDSEPRDIEDIVGLCRAGSACPYLCSHMLAGKADVVLTPYTYIIDPTVRESLPTSLLRNNIVILDEAHNFPEQCCDYFTASLSIRDVHVIGDVYTGLDGPALGEFAAAGGGVDIVSFRRLSPKIKRLSECFGVTIERDSDISKFNGESNKQLEYVQKDAEFMYKIFEDAGITPNDAKDIVQLNASCSEHYGRLGLSFSITVAIDAFSTMIKALYPNGEKNEEFINSHFCACVTSDLVVHLLCFSPAVGFRQIVELRPRTVIMTSGTLAPFKSFVESLDNKFELILENPHIADPSQLMLLIASRNKARFQFTYRNRSDELMRVDFASCFGKLLRMTPSGFLCFFPSFSALEDILPHLKSKGVKQITVEPRDHRLLKTALTKYKERAAGGAALFGVCRGKMSEGIDFADDYARCVCVVGVPFPNLGDFKVALHRAWLDKKRPGNGSRWYTESAMRAVNQSIGRAIRHKDDYAAVVLFDERYEGFKNMLSRWTRPSVKSCGSWPDVERFISAFFAVERPQTTVTLVHTRIPEPLAVMPAPERACETRAEEANRLLRSTVDKDERNRLCLILRRFKKMGDPAVLKDGLTSLRSDESRSIIMKVMHDKLRDRVGDS